MRMALVTILLLATAALPLGSTNTGGVMTVELSIEKYDWLSNETVEFLSLIHISEPTRPS